MATRPEPAVEQAPASHLALVAAAWLLSIGIDFLLHAGLLARLYLRDEPFLLPADLAFARIPAGYLSFLVLTGALWWLLRRTDARGFAPGVRAGLVFGAVAWGAFLLGLWSISTAPADLLAGWWMGQSLELGAAGGVLGAGLAATARAERRRIYLRVVALVVACIVVTVLLQSVGWAPAMDTVGR